MGEDIMKEKIIKRIVYILIALILISIVYADRTCQDVQEANVPCQIVTPVIVDCSTYDLYNSTLELTIDDGAMSQIGNTGLFNFTFNQPDEGTHKGILCDNTTFTIEVANYSNKGIYTEVKSITNIDGSWLDNLVKKVWAHLVGYVDPSAVSLNASDTLKTIAENTEYGGY